MWLPAGNERKNLDFPDRSGQNRTFWVTQPAEGGLRGGTGVLFAGCLVSFSGHYIICLSGCPGLVPAPCGGLTGRTHIMVQVFYELGKGRLSVM